MFIVFDKCDYINDLVHVTVTWVKVLVAMFLFVCSCNT